MKFQHSLNPVVYVVYNFQIALSLVMGKLVELTGLTHYYIIVACLGRWQYNRLH